MPRALQRFCTARLVSRVAGMHLNSTLGTQVMWRDGPMTEGEISPRARPGLSPLVMGIVVSRLCAGMPINRIFQTFGMPMGDRKSVVEGKSVSVRVDLGGRRILKKKKTHSK